MGTLYGRAAAGPLEWPHESLHLQRWHVERHETINRRFKQWDVLKQVFRHDISLHETCFTAVANIEQLSMQVSPTWQVDYYDRNDNNTI